jgi:predicted dehydrogenase
MKKNKIALNFRKLVHHPVRLGLVGCGAHSQENLIPALWNLQGDDVRVEAVCDPDPIAASLAVSRIPGASAYPNYEELLSLEGLDAIVVAAPPRVHVAVAALALSRGLHIFTEKPVAVDSRSLKHLADMADKAGLITMVGHNLRHSNAVRHIKRQISSPAFGNIAGIDCRYFASKPRGDRWGLKSPLRSFLLSHVSHALDLMIHMAGPISSVSASSYFGTSGDVSIAARFIFCRGGVGSLLATSGAPHFEINLGAVGTNQTMVELDSLRRVEMYRSKRRGTTWVARTLDTGYSNAGYQNELEAFVRSIKNMDSTRGVKAQPSFRDELDTYYALDEIYRGGQRANGRILGKK